MSSDDLNETTKNFLIALQEFKPDEITHIIKLTYDEQTGIVNGVTFEDTDRKWIEITREQYDAGIQYKRLKVVNGKLEEIPRNRVRQLYLVEGKRWYTTQSNMLIMGNEKGWDERGNS